MNNSASTSRYILTALAVILVVTSFILVGLNALHLESRLSTGATTVQTAYKDGYLAARKKYQEICPIVAQSTFALSGTVLTVSGNGLKVLAKNLDTDPAVDGVSDERNVTLAANAVVQRSVVKTPEQLNKELAANPKTPPSPVTLSSIRLSDIHVGDSVFVTSATDVRLAPSIMATSITVRQ